MLHVTFAVTLGWLGVTFGFVSTIFQFRRAFRISVDGISLVTWYQFILMGMFWISYGFAVHKLIIIMGAACVMPMQIAIVGRLKPWLHSRVILRSTMFIVVCSVVPSVLFGWSAGVLGTGVAMVFNRIPQILTLARHPGDLGVSAGSWTIGAICSAMWIVYYFGEHLWAGAIATMAAMIGNIAIAVLAAWRHRQVADVTMALSNS